MRDIGNGVRRNDISVYNAPDFGIRELRKFLLYPGSTVGK